MSLSFFFLSSILTLSDLANARTVRKEPFKLILSPIHAAIFAFTIIFGIAFLLQSLSSAGTLGNTVKLLPSGQRGATYYYVGKLYIFLIFFAIISLVVYHVLYAYKIVYTLNDSLADLKSVGNRIIAGRDLVLHMAHWFIVLGLLVLLLQRERIAVTEKASRSRLYMWKAVVDGVLLLVLLAIIITYAALEGIYQTLGRKQALDTLMLSRAYVSFQAILTFHVIGSLILTWSRLKTSSESDSIMIGQIIKYISPFLLLQTIYEIAEYALIYTSISLRTIPGALDSLILTRILVFGITNFIILWVAS